MQGRARANHVLVADVIEQCAVSPGGGGGTPHMKAVGMLVGNFELNP